MLDKVFYVGFVYSLQQSCEVGVTAAASHYVLHGEKMGCGEIRTEKKVF